MPQKCSRGQQRRAEVCGRCVVHVGAAADFGERPGHQRGGERKSGEHARNRHRRGVVGGGHERDRAAHRRGVERQERPGWANVDRAHLWDGVIAVRRDAAARERIPDAAATDLGEMNVVVRVHHVAEDGAAGDDLRSVRDRDREMEVLEDAAALGLHREGSVVDVVHLPRDDRDRPGFLPAPRCRCRCGRGRFQAPAGRR